ncbi:MAG: prepilin-type N-terminal cleavage/methylation domain-containing protein [Pseudomonadota bacterium]
MRHGYDLRGFSMKRADGFTLVEMVAVMSITALVAAMAAVFLRAPLQSYQDTERRAAMTDAADTAFVLMKRDLQNALPNSVRIAMAGSVVYLEMLSMRSGGRYRANAALPGLASGPGTCPDVNGNASADENALQFGIADSCFTSLGNVPGLAGIVPGSDFVVVYNLGSGFLNADAYSSGNATGGNKSLITSVATGVGGENVIAFESTSFNLDSPGRRFQVVSGPVTFVCDPTAGTLSRISGYAITAAQLTPPVGATALLAKGVTACTLTYDQNVINQRNGIVSIWLRLTDPGGGAIVSLFQQVQVSNLP